MALIISWSGDAAWVFYLLTFIQLAAGTFSVVRYYRKISRKYKKSV